MEFSFLFIAIMNVFNYYNYSNNCDYYLNYLNELTDFLFHFVFAIPNEIHDVIKVINLWNYYLINNFINSIVM